MALAGMETRHRQQSTVSALHTYALFDTFMAHESLIREGFMWGFIPLVEVAERGHREDTESLFIWQRPWHGRLPGLELGTRSRWVTLR